jgi:hypothetical protein
MKKIGIIFCLFIAFGFVNELNPQSKEITQKFFPEIEIENTTPALKKTKGYTSYEELIQFLNELQSKHPEILTITFIGESQKGKAVPMVSLNKKNQENKIKVWLQGGLHGDEMASTEAMLFLLEKLLNDPNYEYLLDKLHICMVPMANIDGYEKEDRYAANGLDLNRDQTKLIIKESVFLKQTFSDFNADVAVDFHEFRPYRKEFAQLGNFGICSRQDVMFMSSGNLNVPEKLRNYTNSVFVKNAQLALDKEGLKHREYLTSDKVLGEIHFNQGSNSARSSATSYALANTISSLIEVRGVGIGRTSFKRRIFTGFTIGLSYLKSAYEHASELKEILKPDTMSLVVVKSKKEIKNEPLNVIDLETNNETNIEVEIHNASKSTATLSRNRPFYYLIDNSQTELITKLHILGIKTETLTSDKTLEVESYLVKEYEKSPEKDEGVYSQNIKTEVITKNILFNKGSFLVNMNQENAGLIVEVLEPEAPNSFVSFGVLQTNKDAVLPIYRYMRNEKLY